MHRERSTPRTHGEPGDQAIAQLREQAAALDREGTLPEQVDAFAAAVAAEAKARPSRALADLLAKRLDDAAVADHPTTDGEGLRAKLLAAQQALGFPWALEVEPENLPLLRRPGPSLGTAFARVWLGVCGVFAAASYAFAARLAYHFLVSWEWRTDSDGSPADLSSRLLPVAFSLAAVQAVAAVVAALRFKPRWLVDGVGWACAGALLPLVNSLAHPTLENVLEGTLLAIPSFVISITCLLLAGRAPK